MSKPVTLADLRLGALRRTDQETTGYFSNSEVTDYINQSVAEWYEVQIGYGEELYLDSAALALTGSVDTYQLPDNFFRVRGVDANVGGYTFDIQPFNFNDRNMYLAGGQWTLGSAVAYRVMGASTMQGPHNGAKYLKFIPKPSGMGTATIWYYPLPPVLVGDAEFIDGAAGWEEFIILHAAAKMLIKQQRDPSTLLALAGSEMTRIQSSAAKVDAAHPAKVSIVRRWGKKNRTWL